MRLISILVLSLLLAAPSAALAQTAAPSLPGAGGAQPDPNALQPLAPAPSQQPTTTAPQQTSNTSSSSNGGITGGQIAALGIGALVLISLIAAFIYRDARRRAKPKRRKAAMAAGPTVSPATAVPGARGRVAKQRAKGRKPTVQERRRRKRGRAR